ncbi:MAG: hypothetical protein JO227_05310 [Acetobacteraceae bacterium]|nr:hypothetical protein [Acetobacteraceae bacterium]
MRHIGRMRRWRPQGDPAPPGSRLLSLVAWREFAQIGTVAHLLTRLAPLVGVADAAAAVNLTGVGSAMMQFAKLAARNLAWSGQHQMTRR